MLNAVIGLKRRWIVVLAAVCIFNLAWNRGFTIVFSHQTDTTGGSPHRREEHAAQS